MSRSRKKEYTGAKKYANSCRNHGGCPYCESNRLHTDRRDRKVADEKIAEYNQE